MNKKLLVLLLLFSITLAGCQKIEENEENEDNNGAISVQPIENGEMSEEPENTITEEEEEVVEEVVKPIVITPKPKANPRICETDKDCVAIAHPDNTCFMGFFNKNSYEAMEDWRKNEDVSAEECSEFSNPVCVNNRCAGLK